MFHGRGIDEPEGRHLPKVGNFAKVSNGIVVSYEAVKKTGKKEVLVRLTSKRHEHMAQGAEGPRHDDLANSIGKGAFAKPRIAP
jgi:hypothetical protein